MNRTIALLVAGLLAAASLGATAAAPSLRIVDAWARATPPGAPTGVIYLTVVNDGQATDRLLGASTPAAAKAEPHTMSMTNMIMTMRPAKDGLPVPAHGRLMLSPSGDHLMLTGLKGPLKTGTKLALTVRFAGAGPVKVEVPVRDNAPAGAAISGHDHMHMH
ncbi:MAG: copper chaperone PCu(A)C [Caulobacteraceae bacterium]